MPCGVLTMSTPCLQVNYGSATWFDKVLGTYRDAKTVFPASWPDAVEHAKSS